MNKPVTINPASVDHIACLYTIEKMCYDNPWSYDTFKNEFTYPESLHYIIFTEDSGITGYLLSWKVVDEIHIHNIAVLPAFRRKGYARLLLSTIFSIAKSKGIARIYLEVRENNVAATKLYLNSGFTVTSKRLGYYSDGQTALLMTKVI